jgi:hypothetical protein
MPRPPADVSFFSGRPTSKEALSLLYEVYKHILNSDAEDRLPRLHLPGDGRAATVPRRAYGARRWC